MHTLASSFAPSLDVIFNVLRDECSVGNTNIGRKGELLDYAAVRRGRKGEG